MIKINFLYWNVNNKNLACYISEVCLENKADVLILAEHKSVDLDYLTRKLNEKEFMFEIENIIPNSRILLLHKRGIQIKVVKESRYYSAFKLKHDEEQILIFALHLPSKYAQETSDLNMYTSQIIREFEQIEEERKISRSLVVGDFNMSPFDEGMISALGFNAVMSTEIARKKSRKVLNQERKFYYNPMWHMMGNDDHDCKGTFYYSSSTKSFYWYTYDQVILRPQLIDNFSMDNLRIINKINDKSLITKSNVPNKKEISDHLPIKFKINMEG